MDAYNPAEKNAVQKGFMTVLRRRPVLCFLGFWFIFNLLQITFTELTSDEGYYWFYAQHLQWGYYDHPPMVAAMIKAGSALFPGEAGVRFFNVVFSTAALYLFFTLLPVEAKRSRKTYLVLLSAPLLHYLTFLVFPDGPLLTFSLLFLVLYKRFLARQNLVNALWLGLSIGLMAYSKYHGALVLLFTTIANLKLLKSRYFYVSLAVAVALFLPHLWWQYQNDFPTLKYHLSGRTGSWSFKHVGEYLSQQLVAIGPGLIFIPFVAKTSDVFERTLKVIIIGAFAFFLVSSFKTFVHFHWTSIALYPILYFAVRYYNNPQRKKIFNWLILPFVVLFFIARILLAVPLITNMHVGEDYYHGRKAWAENIKTLAGNKPVFMPDNLREASLYSFYSGQQGVTLYTRPEKKSQYELWGYEDSLQNRDVLFLTKYAYEGSTKISLLDRDFYYSTVPQFQSYYNGLVLTSSVINVSTDSIKTVVTLTNVSNKPISFSPAKAGRYIGILYSFEQKKKTLRTDATLQLTEGDNLAPGASVKKAVAISVADLPKGEYDVYFGVRSGVLPDAILSTPSVFRR